MELVSFIQSAPLPSVKSASSAEPHDWSSHLEGSQCLSSQRIKEHKNRIQIPAVSVKLESTEEVTPSKKLKTLHRASRSSVPVIGGSEHNQQIKTEAVSSVPIVKIMRPDSPKCLPLDLRKKTVDCSSLSKQCEEKAEPTICSAKAVAKETKSSKDLDSHKFSFWTIDCSKTYIRKCCDDGLKLKLKVNDALKIKLSNTQCFKKAKISDTECVTVDPEEKTGNLELGESKDVCAGSFPSDGNVEGSHRLQIKTDSVFKMNESDMMHRKLETGKIKGTKVSGLPISSKVPGRKSVGNMKKQLCSAATKKHEGKADASLFAHHPCLFAIHMDNVTVHMKKDSCGRQVYLVAYTSELESLTKLSVEGIEKLKNAEVQEPAKGIRVLLAFPNGHVSASGSVNQPVITVERDFPQSSLLSSLAQTDLLNRGTDDASLENVCTDGSASFDSGTCVVSQDETSSLQEAKVHSRPSENSAQVADSKCLFCGADHAHGVCFVENPACTISDSSSCSNSQVLALVSLPSQLSLTRSADGFTVCAAEIIEKGALLGPLQGEQIELEKVKTLSDLKNIWCVQRKSSTSIQSGQNKTECRGKQRRQPKAELEDMKPAFLLSTESECLSNWCRYLHLVTDFKNSNLLSIERQGNLHFVTSRNIDKGEELTVYCPLVKDLDCLPFPDDHQCVFCPQKLDSQMDFAKHCYVVHPNSVQKRLEKCNACGEMFLTDAESESHGCRKVNQLKKGGLRQVRCRRRRRTMVKGDKHLLMCCECGKSFGSSLLLSQHLLTHESYFRYFCQFCQKGFHDKSNLKVHLLIHTGVRPFRCQQLQCTAAFTTKQCLQIHYRKLHGFSDASMPVIHREVPFTFEAHMAE